MMKVTTRRVHRDYVEIYESETDTHLLTCKRMFNAMLIADILQADELGRDCATVNFKKWNDG